MKHYINLLPPDEQDSIAQSARQSEVTVFSVWLGASILLLSLGLLGARVVFGISLENSVAALASARGQLQSLESSQLQNQVQDLNADLQNLQILNGKSGGALQPSAALMELAQLLPADVTVDSLSLVAADGKVELSGHAGTRKSVLDLRASLVKSPMFANVNFPLRNLESATDVTWRFRFYLR